MVKSLDAEFAKVVESLKGADDDVIAKIVIACAKEMGSREEILDELNSYEAAGIWLVGFGLAGVEVGADKRADEECCEQCDGCDAIEQFVNTIAALSDAYAPDGLSSRDAFIFGITVAQDFIERASVVLSKTE